MTDRAFDKAEALARFRQARSDLFASLEDLSEQEQTQVPVVERWTVRDMLAHILAWEDVAAQRLDLFAAGRAGEIRWVQDKELEDINARFHEEKRGLSLTKVRESLEKTGRKLEERLEGLPAGVPEGSERIAVWLPNCTYIHYQEHLEQIAAWRRGLETTEK